MPGVTWGTLPAETVGVPSSIELMTCGTGPHEALLAGRSNSTALDWSVSQAFACELLDLRTEKLGEHSVVNGVFVKLHAGSRMYLLKCYS